MRATLAAACLLCTTACMQEETRVRVGPPEDAVPPTWSGVRQLGNPNGTDSGVVIAAARDAVRVAGDLSSGRHAMFVAELAPTGATRSLYPVATGSDEDEILTGAAWDVAGGAYVSFVRGDALDAYVARLDGEGRAEWVVALPDELSVNAPGHALAVDAAGDVYVARTQAADTSDLRAALTKVAPSGEILWTRHPMGGSSERGSLAFAVSIAPDGSVWTAGSVLGPDAGSSVPRAADAFVASYDPSGAPLASVVLAGPSIEYATSLAATADGVYVSGVLHDVASTRSFVAGLGRGAEVRWMSEMDARLAGVAADANGAWVAGWTEHPGSNDASDSFVARLDRSGAAVWETTLGAPFGDAIAAIAVREGTAYVTGWASGAFPSSPPDAGSAFVAAIDPTGRVR